jgi:outer membrane lipoprotein-sorting protein
MQKIILVSIITSLYSGLCLSETAEEKGLAIAVEADKRDQGFTDSKAVLKMILRNAQGRESKRDIRSQTLEQQDDGDKTLIIFDRPRDVKGTALLSFTHKAGSDDQWLYLPALKRVKRIASKNKSGPFMGSEFAYEDLSSQEVEKYTYKYLRDEICPSEEYKDLNCFVMERYPVDKNSGYTRQLAWVDKKEYRPIKIDYYDRKSSLLKTSIFKGYKQYLGQYWRAAQIDMTNHQSKKSTTISWDNYQFKTGLKERDFTKNRLKTIR